MTRAIVSAVFIWISAALVAAQADTSQPAGSVPQRHVSASKSLTDFRPVGETRLWTYFARQQRIPFGKLVSVVKEQTKVDGRDAVVLTQNLEIDYTKIGADRKVAVSGETRLSLDGFYLGTQYTIGTGDSAEKLELECVDSRVRGFFTRAGDKVGVDLPLGAEAMAWDPSFADELEIYLARQDLNVGDSLRDSVYAPQSTLMSSIRGAVTLFMWREIYEGKFDSVYVIDLSEPNGYRAFFTPDKRLVRLDLPNQNIRMYQDAVRRPQAAAAAQTGPVAPKPSPFSPRLIIFRLPHYIAYVLVALATVVFFTRAGFKWLDSYFALAAGAVVYLLVLVTQTPLQKLLASTLVAPMVSGGGSVYGWMLLPPLVAGVVQELIKWAVLAGLVFWRRAKEYRYATLGSFLGAGFGIVESSHVLGVSIIPLFGWTLLERTFVIVFHVAAGAMLGQAMARGRSMIFVILPILIGANTLIRYLPVFVQRGGIDIGLMHFVLAFLSLGLLLAALVVLRRTESREP
jgi:hypothetical protein